MQRRLIWEPMLYQSTPSYNTMEAIKNICCRKSDGGIDHGTAYYALKVYLKSNALPLLDCTH